MSEELLQTAGVRIGRYTYYRLGATTLAALHRAGMIGRSIPENIRNRKPDGIITLGKGVVKACIEYKTPRELATGGRIASAIEQEREPARLLCNLLIVTDGTRTIWINPHTGKRITSERTLPTFDAKALVARTASVEELRRIEQAIDEADHSLSSTNDRISSPTLLDPSQLARTIWQKIWINTGKEPEKCLYNVVELFVFKFLSDLGVLEAHNNFAQVYELGKDAGREAALTSYARLSRQAIRRLFPDGPDHTTIINGTIFVNERGEPNLSQARLFCEVLEDLQAFDRQHGSFRYIQREFKTRLYESFLRESAGLRLLGQYFTPRNVVQAIVRMSGADALPDGASLCDPFCGVGGFLLEAIIESPRLLSQFEPHNGAIEPAVSMVGYDRGADEREDERTIILAKANTIIYFSDLIAKHHDSGFISEFARKVVNSMFVLLRTNLGTFEMDNDGQHDLILTNPPYVTRGSSSLKAALTDAGLTNRYPASGRGTEALALQWIIRSLKPGGSAFVIVPDGLLNQEAMLDYVKRLCFVRAVVSLPVRTFYSTPKKTYILAIQRKGGNDPPQHSPVFMYLVSEIGESRDARRWVVEQNDLTEMTGLFNQFKGSPDTFASPSLRCKVASWTTFDGYRHWMADRYWSPDELQELGEVEEAEELNVREFNDLLSSAGCEQLDPSGMEQARFVNVSLGDEGLFEVQIGERVLKKDSLEGDIPCISANVHDVFGYVTESRLLGNDWSRPSLVWGVDGSFDWHLIEAGMRFHPTDHCGVLRIRDPNIDPEYLWHTLRATRERYGFDRTYRAKLKNIVQVEVPVPVSDDGSMSLELQREMAAKYREIEERRARARNLLQQIVDARVTLDSA